MARVLVVEDSSFFGTLVKNQIESHLDFEVVWARSYKEAVSELEKPDHDFFISLLDLNLPDAPNGEIVDFVLSKKIPVVVFTGSFNPEQREVIWKKGVVDYIQKEGNYTIDYLLSMLRRIHLNRYIKVLVVDDSPTARFLVTTFLKVHQYQVLEAKNGPEALEMIERHPDLKIVITDYNMPGMNGDELTKKIRFRHNVRELAIIGISTHQDSLLSAQFIKSGANDFLHKPFVAEELYCRITHNIQMLEYISKIEDYSNRDYLTQLFNRRYFFSKAIDIYNREKSKKGSLAVALIDIDHFKNINDTFGHDTGDQALKNLSRQMVRHFTEPDLVARFGGEEFCILTTGQRIDAVSEDFESFRKIVEADPITTKENEFPMTISTGVCTRHLGSIEEMISKADEMLYQAKTKGRNMVCSY